MASVVWLHGGACNGNTQSFLNAEEPTVVDLVTDFGIEIIYHHSCIPLMGEQAKSTLLGVLENGGPDIFVMEGTVIQGPNGSGRYDYGGRDIREPSIVVAPWRNLRNCFRLDSNPPSPPPIPSEQPNDSAATEAPNAVDTLPAQVERYYYQQGGKTVGPVPAGILKALAENGTLSDQDLVWAEGEKTAAVRGN